MYYSDIDSHYSLLYCAVDVYGKKMPNDCLVSKMYVCVCLYQHAVYRSALYSDLCTVYSATLSEYYDCDRAVPYSGVKSTFWGFSIS